MNTTFTPYTAVAKGLHWLMALLILGLLVLGMYMHDLPLSPQKLALYSWHKWAGVTAFVLVWLRLAWRVGQALAPLAQQGFLIVASGNVTHNLRDWQLISMTGQPTPGYVQQFADWVHTQMSARNTEALLNYRHTQAAGAQAHPRDEHLLPLFTALGAAGADAQPEAFYRGIYDHVIAMDGYAFH